MSRGSLHSRAAPPRTNGRAASSEPRTAQQGNGAAATDRGGIEQVVTLSVDGMTCEGCAAALRHGLARLGGVTHVDVDLERDEVVLRGPPGRLDADAARRAVGELGYRVAVEAPAKKDGPRWSLTELILGAALVMVAGTLLFRLGVDSYLGGGALAGVRETFAEVSPLGIGLGFVFGVIMAFAPVTYAMAPAVMGYVTRARARSTGEAARLSAAFMAGNVSVDIIIGAAFAAGGAVAVTSFSA